MSEAEPHPKELHPKEVELLERKIALADLELAASARVQAQTLAESAHSGVFHLVGEIHEGSVHNLIGRIQSFRTRYPDQPIRILLNSGGGSVVDGFALIDYIKLIESEGTHVTIVGLGACFSMAGLILQSANERLMTPRAFMGLHEVQSGTRGGLSTQEDQLKFASALQDMGIALLCEKSNLTPAKLRNMWKRRDVFVDAPTALKLGLIDRIEEC